jgi:hypothetical protein
VLEITPLIRTEDGCAYALIGFSRFTGQLRVRSLEFGYETTIFKTAVVPRNWSPLEIEEGKK